MESTTTSSIVKSISVENMVAQRNAVVERIEAVLRLLTEAEELAKTAHVGMPRLMLDGPHGRTSFGMDDAETARRAVDGPAWQYLLSESGLQSFMDSTAREKWGAAVHSGEVPPLTVPNVEATFQELYKARGEMFERGVLGVFRRLSWDYKTNLPHKFGKRIVMTYFVDNMGFPSRVDEVDDLMRVLCVLDGQPEPDHRNGTRHMVYSLGRTSTAAYETAYFALKWFKNGNAHIAFKRPDLVERLNQILAKHHPNALPPRT